MLEQRYNTLPSSPYILLSFKQEKISDDSETHLYHLTAENVHTLQNKNNNMGLSQVLLDFFVFFIGKLHTHLMGLEPMISPSTNVIAHVTNNKTVIEKIMSMLFSNYDS
jgi:hypothetical protein